MTLNYSIYGHNCNFDVRYIPDYAKLQAQVEALKLLGFIIVLTSGGFDMKHIGHDMYLEKAKARGIQHAIEQNKVGAVLLVGLESDERIRQRKKEFNKFRPIVEQYERAMQLCMLRSIDLVTLKNANDPKWHLIKTVRPDILIVSERTNYSEAEILALKEFCGQIVVLESQATTSTTARIRSLLVGHTTDFKARLSQLMSELDQLAGGQE